MKQSIIKRLSKFTAEKLYTIGSLFYCLQLQFKYYNVECYSAKCCSAECRYGECRGANKRVLGSVL
jgi:hypothetical protein